MRRLLFVTFMAIGFSLLLISCKEVRKAPQKWEYSGMFSKDKDFVNDLNKGGKMRWELAHCRRARTGEGKDIEWGYECVLKRPLKE